MRRWRGSWWYICEEELISCGRRVGTAPQRAAACASCRLVSEPTLAPELLTRQSRSRGELLTVSGSVCCQSSDGSNGSDGGRLCDRQSPRNGNDQMTWVLALPTQPSACDECFVCTCCSQRHQPCLGSSYGRTSPLVYRTLATPLTASPTMPSPASCPDHLPLIFTQNILPLSATPRRLPTEP